MEDVFLRKIILPLHIFGVVVTDINGESDIFINQNTPDNKLKCVLAHEEKHVLRGHLYDDRKSVAEKELEAGALENLG